MSCACPGTEDVPGKLDPVDRVEGERGMSGERAAKIQKNAN